MTEIFHLGILLILLRILGHILFGSTPPDKRIVVRTNKDTIDKKTPSPSKNIATPARLNMTGDYERCGDDNPYYGQHDYCQVAMPSFIQMP